jgi:redox-sensitive bicupin YhaK (pirin superfamily)
MPILFEPEDLPVTRQSGARVTTLANSAMLQADALQVERLSLEAHATSSMYNAVEAERFVYVIGGNGQAHVHTKTFPLERESVLWLEQNDAFSLEAGADGLDVLLCHAPAKE